MWLSAIQAAKNVNASFGVPFEQIELCPMIGQNDMSSEVTTLADIDTIVAWVCLRRTVLDAECRLAEQG